MSRHATPQPPPRSPDSPGAPRRKGAGRGPVLTPARLTGLVLAALAVVLIAENNREVRIRLVVPVVTMPLYLALLIMFVLGGLCGALLIHSRAARKNDPRGT